MTQAVAELNAVETVAKQIEQDIYRRQLRPGDRYLSTRQVKDVYGVKLAVAAQAMQRLVDHDVLVRRDRSGTFIGSRIQPARAHRVQTIYVVMPRERMDYSSTPLYMLVEAIHRQLPGCNVQYAYLPPSDEIGYLEELLAPVRGQAQITGFIAASCSHEVYAYLDQLGLPLVVFGTPESDQQHLPSVDLDGFESGRLLAQHLLDRGHENIAVFALGAGRQGDHDFLDGVVDALTTAKRPPNALVARFSLHNLRQFRAQVDAVLAKDVRPTGIICRSEKMIGTILEAIDQAGLDRRSVEIVHESSSGTSKGHAHARFTWTADQMMDCVVSLLRSVREGVPPAPRRVVMPVELIVPSAVDSTAARQRSAGS